MNYYITSTIMKMKLAASGFEKSCIIAAKRDDGKIDRVELRQLREIQKACQNFIKALDKIK